MVIEYGSVELYGFDNNNLMIGLSCKVISIVCRDGIFQSICMIEWLLTYLFGEVWGMNTRSSSWSIVCVLFTPSCFSYCRYICQTYKEITLSGLISWFLYCDSEIDIDEFKKVMTLMRAHNRQGAHHSDGLRGGRNLGGHVENGGLLQDFFGEDGKKRLQYDRFVRFLRDLHEEVCEL